jgi:nicotinamide mononucleotide transporter
MDPVEVVAVVFGVVSVWLSTREHIAAWPTALVNSSLYALFFWRAGIYANAGLQVVYFALSVYGWYAWKFGGQHHTPLRVTRATRRHWLLLAPLGVVAAVLLALILGRYTDAALPWLDSSTTAASLIAQYLMTRKILENWIIWIVADVVYIGMYVSQGLVLTAGLYAAFLVLATMGLFSWRASLRAQLRAHLPPPVPAHP